MPHPQQNLQRPRNLQQAHIEFSLNPSARQRPCQWCPPTVGGLSWSSIVQPTPEAGDDIVLGSGLIIRHRPPATGA
jgi:hypothetical protein